MEKEKEVWVTVQFINKNGSIEVFPNYQVSNLGRVMSLNYRKSKKPKILKPGSKKQSHGTYYSVTLKKDGKRHYHDIHRLVLSSFEPHEYFKKAVVDHIDSTPSNNCLSNLRWTTQQKNTSTPHLKEAISKAHTNHPSKSKRVRVTFLDDGHSEIFPSASEATRVLGLSLCIVSAYINRCDGFYRKLNVLFAYI